MTKAKTWDEQYDAELAAVKARGVKVFDGDNGLPDIFNQRYDLFEMIVYDIMGKGTQVTGLTEYKGPRKDWERDIIPGGGSTPMHPAEQILYVVYVKPVRDLFATRIVALSKKLAYYGFDAESLSFRLDDNKLRIEVDEAKYALGVTWASGYKPKCDPTPSRL